MNLPISTFILNLKHRPDRKENILKEFSNRDEFKITIVEPVKHDLATISLWITLKYIIDELVGPEENCFIFCEDDHQFTKNYNKKLLYECIDKGDKMNADILSGGVSALQHFVPVSEHFFLDEQFFRSAIYNYI